MFAARGAPLLHPEQQVFEAMLAGWRDQQLTRNLKADSISERLGAVSRFQRFTNDWPWCWRRPIQAFTAQLRGERRALTKVEL